MSWEDNLAERFRARGINFRLLQHEPVLSIDDVARVLKIPRHLMVKVLIFRDKKNGRFITAALPGNQRLNWGKLARTIKVHRSEIDLVDTGEIKGLTGFELGGLPPFGFGRNFYVVFERTLMTHRSLYCSAGSPTRSMEIDSKALLQINGGKLANIC